LQISAVVVVVVVRRTTATAISLLDRDAWAPVALPLLTCLRREA
jgi:hypothetical protein